MMRKFSAIATIEFDDLAAGMLATDAMLKRAPIGLLRSGTISRGRFLTLIAGSTASVDESYREGLSSGDRSIVDSVILVDAHQNVYDAVMGKRSTCRSESIGIIETATVSSNICAAEAAVKGTHVRLIEMRLADSLLDGKGLSIYQGSLYEIQSAMELAEILFGRREVRFSTRIIPAPHDGLVAQIAFTTSFREQKVTELEGGESV